MFRLYFFSFIFSLVKNETFIIKISFLDFRMSRISFLTFEQFFFLIALVLLANRFLDITFAP